MLLLIERHLMAFSNEILLVYEVWLYTIVLVPNAYQKDNEIMKRLIACLFN